jgi:hypothetical protein
MQKGILLFAALVTRETALSVFLGIRSKRKDQFVRGQSFGFVAASGLLGFDVRPSRSMAGFTGQRLQFRVCRPRELRDFRAVAGTASVIADKLAGGRSGWRDRCH